MGVYTNCAMDMPTKLGTVCVERPKSPVEDSHESAHENVPHLHESVASSSAGVVA